MFHQFDGGDLLAFLNDSDGELKQDEVAFRISFSWFVVLQRFLPAVLGRAGIFIFVLFVLMICGDIRTGVHGRAFLSHDQGSDTAKKCETMGQRTET